MKYLNGLNIFDTDKREKENDGKGSTGRREKHRSHDRCKVALFFKLSPNAAKILTHLARKFKKSSNFF